MELLAGEPNGLKASEIAWKLNLPYGGNFRHVLPDLLVTKEVIRLNGGGYGLPAA